MSSDSMASYYDPTGEDDFDDEVSDDCACPYCTIAELQRVLAIKRGIIEGLSRRLTDLAYAAYWYRLMTGQGGPDGSDADEAVAQDLDAALGREYLGPKAQDGDGVW